MISITTQPFPKQQILGSSKLKEFAYVKFKFDKTWLKLIQKVRKQCGKRRNCSLRAISPFPTVFSKDFNCRHVKARDCLGEGYGNTTFSLISHLKTFFFYQQTVQK